MKLRYISTPTDLGGTAVSGCGTIHKSEIKATLDVLTDDLSDDLDLPFNLNDCILGSTGKREYSGDIDLVIDTAWWDKDISAFRRILEESFGDVVARNGDMLHLKFPIVGYNPSYSEAKPRTGFVQIDFNFGDPDWERFYHFSPGDESAYKGAHRNLAIAALTAVIGVSNSTNVDGQNRPVLQIRHKFGPKGLVTVSRKSVKDPRSGDWMKKQVDTILDGPYLDAESIAVLVFKSEDAVPADLESLETIMAATKRLCGMVEQERVWQRMAANFYDWPQGRLFEYPPEIAAYIPINDK